MDPKEFSDILEQLRHRIDDAEENQDEELSDRLRGVRSALRAWGKAGAVGPLPHMAELQAWGIAPDDAPPPAGDARMAVAPAAAGSDAEPEAFAAAEAALTPAADDEAPDDSEDDGDRPLPGEALHAPDESEDDRNPQPPDEAVVAEPATEFESQADAVPVAPAADWDPDDDLQADYDAAQAYLDNRRYRAALDAFEALVQRASGRLEALSEQGRETAAARLAEQLRGPIERAQNHTRKQSQDYRGQRKLWQDVLQIDGRNETAIAAIRALDERDAEAMTRQQINDLRNQLAVATAAKNYPIIVEALTQAETLAASNTLPALQPELDRLTGEGRTSRQTVREALAIGRNVFDDPVSAYKLARDYLDQGVPVVFDEGGLFGPQDAEYEPVEFLRRARQKLLDWSRAKALERRQAADLVAASAPRSALLTLREGEAFLTAELFALEDREALSDTLAQVRRDIADVEARVAAFDAAEKLIKQSEPAPPREKLRLLRQARATYADYPRLDSAIEHAEQAMINVVAGEVANALAVVRARMDQGSFTEALEQLAAARDAALQEAPNYPAGSSLDEQLGRLATLEQEIMDAPQTSDWDPDDDLQADYDAAQAYLDNRRHRAALDAFEALVQRASGRLEALSEQGRETAAARLAEQLRGPIERAQNHARKQSQDYKGQRKLWQDVLQIDGQNETAIAAIRALDERDAEVETRKQIEDLRNQLAVATAAKNYPIIVEALTQAETLAASNTLPALQPELDRLTGEGRASRQTVRDHLGLASTQAASQDYLGAYKMARQYLDQGVPVAFDEGGVFGAVGTEYEPAEFLRRARQKLLDWSRAKALERKDAAAKEAPSAPRRALLTLREGEAFLTDEIFAAEDLAVLSDTLKQVRQDIVDVEARIAPFDAAEKLVNQSEQAPPREKLQLLRQAQAVYADYPKLDRYIQRAEDAVASVVAGELQNEMVRARQKWATASTRQPSEAEAGNWKLDDHAQWAEDQFQEALDVLARARTRAIEEVPHHTPDSTLGRQLQAMEELEKEITGTDKEAGSGREGLLSKRAYDAMVVKLQRVETLLAQHEDKSTPGALDAARQELDKLGEVERRHYLTDARYDRLVQLQGVGESWEQGREAYALASWNKAIPLLNRVAGSNIPEKADAMRMYNRARAAHLVVEARELKKARNWKDALVKLNAAQKAFEAWPTVDAGDAAEAYFREMQQEQKQLSEITRNDQEVQAQLDDAGELLDAADENIKKRKASGILTDRVEPIAQFAEVVNRLTALRDRNLRTTLGSDLEQVLARARRLWRDTYMEGIRFALDKQNEELLRKAVALGRILQVNGLLVEMNEKDMYREAQETFLDLELDRLHRHPPRLADLKAELADLEGQKGDPEQIARLQRDIALLNQEPIHASALIAENRKERLAAAHTETEDLRAQYRAAVEARVRYQLEIEERKGAEAALDFLGRELETPELYQSEEFFARLMRFCWQTHNWTQAYDRARGLASRARLEHAALKSELWQGLTAMAAYLSRGERTRFFAEQQATREKADRQPELLPFVEEQRRWQIAWRIDTLVAEADQVARNSKGTPWLKAITLYAEAYDWAPQDHRIRAGLQAIGAPLIQSLATRIQAAQQLTLQGPLRVSVEQAELDLETLKTIQTVGAPLGLSHDQLQDLDVAVEKLGHSLGPWKRALAKVEAANREITLALHNPRSFQTEDDGGWQFDAARKLLSEAQQEARADLNLSRNITAIAQGLDELETRASDLNDAVHAFRIATQEEKFDEAIGAAQLLNTLWIKRRDSDGFAGLDELIRISYPQVRKAPRTLADHERLAREQKSNLHDWTEWADRAKKTYDELKRLGDEQRGEWKNLKNSKSLASIMDDCDEIIRLSSQFTSQELTRPPDDPKSALALKQQKRIPQTMVAEVGTSSTGYLGRAKKLRADAERELSDLESGSLAKLRAAVDRLERESGNVGRRRGLFGPLIEFIPETFFQTAERYVKECQDVDPHNLDLKRLEDKFKTFVAHRAGAGRS